MTDKFKNIAKHYGEAIGHVAGGGLLFVVILATVFGGSAVADWFTDGKQVDQFILDTLFYVKRIALVLDSILLIVVAVKAIFAVSNSK